MPVDTLLRPRDGSTNLTADETSAAIDLGFGPAHANWVLEVMVPAAAASTTLDIKVQESDTATGTYTDVAVMPQISAPGIYARRFVNKKRFVKVFFDVTGASPNFGAVTAYIKDHSHVAEKWS
jgi:hypothetical protein